MPKFWLAEGEELGSNLLPHQTVSAKSCEG